MTKDTCINKEQPMFNHMTIAVIGCSRGIGKTIAELFAKNGAAIALCDIVKEETLQLRDSLESHGYKAEYFPMDVTEQSSILEAMDKIVSRFAGIDGLVYVARSGKKETLEEHSLENWDMVANVMLRGAFLCAQSVFPYLKESNHHPFIVNISSILARYVGPESAAYHSSKAGLDQLTRYLSVFMGKYGIRVNGVQPGFIVSDENLDRFMSEENGKYRSVAEHCQPIGHIGRSIDVAEAVAFLASSKAKYINGQILSVDGGSTNNEHFYVVMEKITNDNL